MYDDLVKRLRNHAIRSDSGYEIGNSMYLDMLKAADAIEERCQQVDKFAEEAMRLYAKQQKWVPVTERLPECDPGSEVGNIEWVSYGMVNAGCFGRGGRYRDAYFRTWTDETEGIDAKDADYWRAVTIPDPLKEET